MRRAALAALLLIGACSGSEQRAVGVVIAVDGGIAGITSFTVVDEAGDRLTFVPGGGLRSFDDGTPLSHLHEHLQTGVAVRVTYRVEDRGLIAVAVGDAR